MIIMNIFIHDHHDDHDSNDEKNYSWAAIVISDDHDDYYDGGSSKN